MTRINVVPVKELTDQHLLAEYREITRLPKNLYTSLNRKSKPFSEDEIPSQYVLGTGHVKHFMDKFQWLENRFLELLVECKTRGFTTNFTDSTIFRNVPQKYYKDWTVTEISKELNRKRIRDRINDKPEFYRYYGKQIND